MLFEGGLPGRDATTNQSKLERIIGVYFSVLIPIIFKTWAAVAVGIFTGTIFIVPKRHWGRFAAILVILLLMLYKKISTTPKKKTSS